MVEPLFLNEGKGEFTIDKKWNGLSLVDKGGCPEVFAIFNRKRGEVLFNKGESDDKGVFFLFEGARVKRGGSCFRE